MRLTLKLIVLTVPFLSAVKTTEGSDVLTASINDDGSVMFPIIASQSSQNERHLSHGFNRYDFPFQIQSMKRTGQDTFLCLTAEYIGEGAKLIIDDCDNRNKLQYWKTDNYSRILSDADRHLCLMRKVKSKSDGSKFKFIELQNCSSPNDSNTWTFNVFDQTFGWKRNNNQVLTVRRALDESAKAMQEMFLSFNQIFKHANQKWNVFVAPKKFAIKTKIASKEYCIQNAGQNNALVVKECSDDKNQHWSSDLNGKVFSADNSSQCMQWTGGNDLVVGNCASGIESISFIYNKLDNTLLLKSDGRKAFTLVQGGDERVILSKRFIEGTSQNWKLSPIEDSTEILIFDDCTSTNQCPRCHGDCDDDNDCEGSLVCAQRDAFEAVHGCVGNGDENDRYGADVCVDPPLIRYVHECTSKDKCGLCEMDCDDDNDCADGLICLQRDGYEDVDGCFGEGLGDDKYGKDVCVRKSPLEPPVRELPVIAYVGECDEDYQCGLCEGDCDSDDDCADDLVCGKRRGYESVSGCTGEGGDEDRYGKDICFQASQSPSLSPTVKPTESVLPSIEPSVSTSPSLGPSVSHVPSTSTSPSERPSVSMDPSSNPTLSPAPSSDPTTSPSITTSPSSRPSTSAQPSDTPTFSPSFIPSNSPSENPTVTVSPSMLPSVSSGPSASPSESSYPSNRPSTSSSPSTSPSESLAPSVTPSSSPSLLPSNSQKPSTAPSSGPTEAPSSSFIKIIGDCTSTNQCPRCHGDCDDDNDCEGSLVCAQRDAFEAVHGCVGNGDENDRYGADVCVDPPLIRYVHECTSKDKCGLCEMDCDDDNDCADGLICLQRDGYEDVDGCFGEGLGDDKYGKDVCVRKSPLEPPVRELPVIAYVGECDEDYQCGLCEGDCDSDDDCADDLVCGKRRGYESVSGCTGEGGDEDRYGKDICMKPPIIRYVGQCNHFFLCGLCMGDCDSDHDCEGDLVCIQRDNFDPVPGCNGEGLKKDRRKQDICTKRVD